MAAIALFALCEHGIWSYRPWLEFLARYNVPGPGTANTTAKIRLLPRTNAQPPILLFGSSQIRRGLDCSFFQRRFPGRTCQNLAINGGSPLDVLYLLDRVSERVPRHVTILGIFPRVMHLPPKQPYCNLDTLRCLFGSGVWARMRPKDWLHVSGGEVEDVSETLRNKDSLFWLYLVLKGEIPGDLTEEGDAAQQRPVETRPGGAEADGEGPIARVRRFTPAQEFALDLLLQREASNGNLAVVINFPRREGYDSFTTLQARVEYRSVIQQLRSRSDIALITPKDLPPLSSTDFDDVVHLSREGRAKVSTRVADIVYDLERH
jgi:hypothetical protein